MKGLIASSWRVYESYKTFLAVNLILEYLKLQESDQAALLSDYEKSLLGFEKKLMITLEDKLLSGLVHEFAARKIASDLTEAFSETFSV